jgi:hypothetical protein
MSSLIESSSSPPKEAKQAWFAESTSYSHFLRTLSRKRRVITKEGHSGYVLKKGSVLNSWNKRYFSINDACELQYADSELEFKNNPSGRRTISLLGARIKHDVLNESTTFELQCVGTPNMVLKIENDLQLSEWKTNLQLHIDLINEEALHSGERSSALYEWFWTLRESALDSASRLKKPKLFRKKYPMAVFGGTLKSFHDRETRITADCKTLMWGTPGFVEIKGNPPNKEYKSVLISSLHYVDCGSDETIINVGVGVDGPSSPSPSSSSSSSSGASSLGCKVMEFHASNIDERDAWVNDLFNITYYFALARYAEEWASSTEKIIFTDTLKGAVGAAGIELGNLSKDTLKAGIHATVSLSKELTPEAIKNSIKKTNAKTKEHLGMFGAKIKKWDESFLS